jgi:hypothetical protein
MLGKAMYIRPKVVGHFPRPCASGSYVHRAALFILIYIVCVFPCRSLSFFADYINSPPPLLHLSI